ncbi:aspartate/glutamate racemase family protein [Hymenobacter cheonanensis]|uniref:aspartate/glutamate racemase family protein n=1 Tax=Hymenobacter sp. CA2-7 TaxID=3063993 RepID=UPI002712F61C|nr:amino acid racemase [Hymenobacter sp. CA2-7]MDO7888075.1 amino acid racemase [Hymenobacter sp. CA2-7]
MQKKKVGIIGGMGARAGMLLLKHVIEKSPAKTDQEFLEIVLHSNSVIPDRTRAILYNEPSPLPELLRSVALLNAQGVDLIVSACVTSYYYYEAMQLHSRAQLLHPVRLVARHILNTYGRRARVGILATSGTIQTGLFQDVLAREEISYVVLPPALQEDGFMQSVYMENGLKSAVICQNAKDRFFACIHYLKEQGVDVIIGGCTEVAIMADEVGPATPLINVLEVLAQEVVNQSYQEELVPSAAY